ncbi:MAG: lamin tail domain-containing protein, partial [Chloroflexi bacterium]
MNQVRRFALVLALAIAAAAAHGPVSRLAPSAAPVAAVAWPTSSLLITEVVTGGASASDEFVEIFNAGPLAADLVSMEVVYVTATGGTVTRKATWTTSRPLAAGQHLLVANGLGSYAALADATYSGGFAATGGSIALRVVGGAVVDAVGWGDATNAFLEGAAAPAPPAGSSIERRPGGDAGNGTDTNDNAADWFVQSQPVPQNLSSPPTPTPTPSPSPTPTATPTPTPSPSPTPTPTPTPTPSPSPTPTATPTPTPSPS